MRNRFLLISPIIFLLLLWWTLSTLGFVDGLFLPTVSDTYNAFVRFLINGGVQDIWATFYKVLIGFIGATIVAIPAGLLLGLNKNIYKAFEVVIEFLRSLPVVTLFPLFLLFFGIGDASKIAMALFVTFFIVLINTIHGVWHVSETKLKVGKAFRASNFEIIRKIVFFDALPQIFIGLRTALSLTLVVVVVTEMFIGTTHGLGQKIFDSYTTYRVPQLYALIFVIGALGYVLNKGFLSFEKKVIHWMR